MYLAEAKEILQNEYHQHLNLVTAQYQRDFMEEKIRHSYQVLGAGNLLLKHEQVFQKLSKEDKDYLKAIVLLHDVARFEEIIKKKEEIRFDHGMEGAQFLAKIHKFNRLDCVLPIRHHGHLIEQLYEDVDYVALSKAQQERVCQVSYLVRDADKIANFYLLSRDFEKIEHVFFARHCFENPDSQIITPTVWDSFVSHVSVKRGDAHNLADMALFFLGWIYDLNYQTSFAFLQKMGVLDKLLRLFSKFWRVEDYSLIQDEIRHFVCCKL